MQLFNSVTSLACVGVSAYLLGKDFNYTPIWIGLIFGVIIRLIEGVAVAKVR